MEESVFFVLMNQARSGDEAAIGTLLRAFEDDVRLMVRYRLPRVLRGQFDSMDFVQSAWKSFLDDSKRPSPEFGGVRQFRNYLMGVVRYKMLEKYRRRTRSQGYDVTREEPLYVFRGGREELKPMASHDPSPSQEAVAGECLEQLTDGRPVREQDILQLRRLNWTFEEIADRVGTSERTVRRIIDEARLRHDGRGPS